MRLGLLRLLGIARLSPLVVDQVFWCDLWPIKFAKVKNTYAVNGVRLLIIAEQNFRITVNCTTVRVLYFSLLLIYGSVQTTWQYFYFEHSGSSYQLEA
ncbi:hypothetical protein BJP34_32095 [Moorena producens PAL-8-15-08-1]|uniref:Uncharacterized protein n=1 Tax=Moorena producens PAL-8-15-08-1 TaxID=1458985 RepID=A0A1D8U0N9_9CYAN|nr:hypothetical protein BJP34_32095 [Moorena producens PAL-8-15-08-1]